VHTRQVTAKVFYRIGDVPTTMLIVLRLGFSGLQRVGILLDAHGQALHVL